MTDSSKPYGQWVFRLGGPGGAGQALATQGGPNLQALIGEEWDIIGFDPRGIGKTL
jgi:hypothetical protein